MGIPIIVSNTSSLTEVADDGAMIVDPLNPQDLAQAIKSLLRDESLRRKLSQKGIERSQAFSWRKTAEKTIEVYKSLFP